MNINPTQNREFEMTDEEFRFLGQLATQHTGIVFPPHKRDLVYGRLTRRLRAHGFSSFAQYCDLLQSERAGDEISQMMNAVTTNLTSFFREAHHFDHLKSELLIPFSQSSQKKRLRVWSAACSSGMEPYSIAMAMLAIDPHISRHDVKILATDIDSKMLHTAQCGTYSINELGRIPEAYRHHIALHPSTRRMQVSAAAQELVAFRHLNLMDTWPMKGRFDAIFCRNVVIYFDKPTKQALFSRLADMLEPNGLLYIGHSENLTGISDRFRLVGRTTYRRVD